MRVRFEMNKPLFNQTRSRLYSRMIVAATAFRDEHRRRVDRPYPPASVPGEYPAKRTGKLQAGCIVTAPPMPKRGDITVIVADETWYWYMLREWSRLGLLHTFHDVSENIANIILKENHA